MIPGVCLTLKASNNDHKSVLQEKAPIPGFSQHLALPVFSHVQQKHTALLSQVPGQMNSIHQPQMKDQRGEKTLSKS